MKLTRPTPLAPLRIGTRGSPLALAQAYETRDRLAKALSLEPAAFEIVVIRTTGDDRAMIAADRPLKEIGNKGLFTKEIEEALLAGQADIAVHSMKDMPTEQPKGLILDCYLPREDPRDALVSLNHSSLDDLPAGAVLGTSSLRRKAQVLHRRPDLKIVEFRGNVQTRLKKLQNGLAEATFLAMAGLNRLNAPDIPAHAMPIDVMLPAVAQGVIGIERREDDTNTAEMLASIHDSASGQMLSAERAFLAALDGSCETPIGGLAELNGTSITLRGEILRPDGSETISDRLTGPVEDGTRLGTELAQMLKSRAGRGFFSST